MREIADVKLRWVALLHPLDALVSGQVNFVERHRVYGEAFRLGGLTDGRHWHVLSVAFEAAVARVDLLWLVQVHLHDAAAALDRADREALATSEAADGTRRGLELALNDGDWVELLESNLVQVEDVDLPVRVAGDEELEPAAHLVHRLADVRFADLLQLVVLPDPVLEKASVTLCSGRPDVRAGCLWARANARYRLHGAQQPRCHLARPVLLLGRTENGFA